MEGQASANASMPMRATSITLTQCQAGRQRHLQGVHGVGVPAGPQRRPLDALHHDAGFVSDVAPRMVQHRLHRLAVGMQVGDDGDLHGWKEKRGRLR